MFFPINREILTNADNRDIIDMDNKSVDTKRIISDYFKGETPYRGNMIEGSMDYYNSYNMPNGWSITSSTFVNATPKYVDDTYNGTYSGYLATRGTETMSSSIYLRQNIISANVNISNPTYLKAYYKILNNTGASLGSNVYFNLQIQTSTGYYALNYVVSGTRSNYTQTVSYIISNSSTNWIYLERNITADFEYAFNTTNAIIRYIYFNAFSVSNDTNLIEALVDSYRIENATGYNFVENYDFGSPYIWYAPSSSNAAIYDKSSESVEGDYSFEGICPAARNTRAYINLYKYYQYQNSYLIHNSGDIIIGFNWWYNATENGGPDQYLMFTLELRNNTYYTYVTYYLGIESNYVKSSNYITPSYSYIYVNDTINNERATWHYTTIDPYQILFDNNITDMSISRFTFYVQSGLYENSTCKFRIDNFTVISDAIPNGDFENHHNGDFSCFTEQGMVNYTTDSISGYAINMTSINNNIASATHNYIYLPASQDVHAVVGSKIITMPSTDTSYALLEISLNETYTITYVLKSVDMSYSNMTYVEYILLNNSENAWTYMQRNIAEDATYFGNYTYIITNVQLYIYTESTSPFTILFDNLFLIKDIHAPTISDISTNPANPVYYTSTTIRANITDFTDITEALIYYTSTSTSGSIAMTRVGDHYEGTIPPLPCGTVEFYFNVTDKSGNRRIDNNGGTNYSFEVGDDVLPDVSISNPIPNSNLKDNITVSVDASDVGSGIAYVRIYLNTTFVAEDSSEPFTFNINTRQYPNGNYSLRAIAYDGVGNHNETSIDVTLGNDFDGPNFSNLQIFPTTPEYSSNTIIQINIEDTSGVSSVIISYNTGSSWTNVTMTRIGTMYSVEIPAQPYGTVVNFYIIAQDIYENIGLYGSKMAPESFTVGDVKAPVGSVSAPANESTINGVLNIQVYATDPDSPQSSGIDKVNFYIDGTLTQTDSEAPFLFVWDTTKLVNGEHTLRIVVLDKAGNAISISLQYTVNNPVGIEAVGAAGQNFMSQFGFFLGAGSVIAVIVVYKFIMKRKGES